VLKDLTTEPLGQGKDGPVFLKDVWPTSHEVAALLGSARDPATFRRLYGDLANTNPMWKSIASGTGQVYDWPRSTYIAKPPFFEGFRMVPSATGDIRNARALGIFGDSVTTDHISPAGSIKPTSPAGLYLQEKDVSVANFNSYGARRGNHEVMMRGTFANVRIKNLMLPPREDGTRVEGGVTLFQPGGERMAIYDAAMRYMQEGRADRGVRRRGVRHGQLARLGGQGHAAPRRQGGDRQELRAHPLAATSSAWACCRCSSRRPDVAIARHQGRRAFDIAVPADIARSRT
jgi:aconitate hydratase